MPLTIAVSRPGESVFSKVFVIRTSVFAGTPGVSDPRADFSWTYAVEHEGQLYIRPRRLVKAEFSSGQAGP